MNQRTSTVHHADSEHWQYRALTKWSAVTSIQPTINNVWIMELISLTVPVEDGDMLCLPFHVVFLLPTWTFIVVKSAVWQPVNICDRQATWLTNNAVCASGNTCLVNQFMLQITPDEFKESHCVLVNLLPDGMPPFVFDLFPGIRPS